MKANEIRIGNLINLENWIDNISFLEDFEATKEQLDAIINNGIGFAKVVYVTLDDVGLEAYSFDLDFFRYEELAPIVLDERILSNLIDWNFVGFGTRIIYSHMKFNAIKIEMCKDDVCVYFNDELISFKKHLHELQNLFFHLTNEELKFKSDM